MEYGSNYRFPKGRDKLRPVSPNLDEGNIRCADTDAGTFVLFCSVTLNRKWA